MSPDLSRVGHFLRLGDFVTMMSNFDVLLWSSEHVDDQLTVVLTYGDGKDVARLLKSQWQLPPVGAFPA